ncbi:MAG: class I SAM-dependent methyltransferase [Sandaracinaceae bacterium]
MGRKKKKQKIAKTADRHALYQSSVQDPSFEVKLASKRFKRHSGRKARLLREDFCGTALLCAEWVKSHPDRKAVGVDLDPEVLDWGRVHNIVPLGEDMERVRLVEGDVREQDGVQHDVVMALNYSYFCFQDRATLRGYFESVRKNLAEDGLFMLDLFGGWEAGQVLKERRKVRRFHYVWHQAAYDPITAHFLGHIHFEFKDGSKLKKAFTYDWRLWTIPELRELLEEAGFEHIELLMEGSDEDGAGNGVFKAAQHAENDPGYNAYFVASAQPPVKKKKKNTDD